MNMFKKSIALFIVIVMVLAAVPAAFAADCLPGNSVTVTLNLGQGYGFDGDIAISDPNGIISGITFSGPDGFSDFEAITAGSGYTVYATKDNVSTIGTLKIFANVTLKNDTSKVGKSATITFSGNIAKYDDTTGDYNDTGSASATVTMIQPAVEEQINYDELKKQINIAESLNKGDYTADSWKALENALANAKNHLTSKDQAAVDKAAADLAAAIAALVKATQPKPEPQPGTTTVNYDELKKQISIAESLNKDEYTADSWKALEDALANAKDHLTSKDQAAVDKAAADLAAAIAALVKIDYSKLEEAIAAGNEYLDNDEIGKLWKDLLDALANGNALLGSGDQAAVDAAAENILDIIEALKAAIAEALENAGDGEGCEHDGLFCNIRIHKLWPILFFISLIGNVVLVFVIFFKKKKEEENKR